MRKALNQKLILALGISVMTLSGCSSGASGPGYAGSRCRPAAGGGRYLIRTSRYAEHFVWRNSELNAKIQVRPDGRTTPLITDMPAVGKTPTMLAQDIKLALSQYINDPIVSVIVNEFASANSQQVSIVGAIEKPASAYRANPDGARCDDRRWRPV